MASVHIPEFDPKRPNESRNAIRDAMAKVDSLNDFRLPMDMETFNRLNSTPEGRWFLALNKFKKTISGLSSDEKKQKLIEWQKENPNPKPLTAEEYGEME